MSDDSLEHRLREKPVFIQRTSSSKVLDEVKNGRKFIIVDEKFTPSMVPLGYMLIDMKYKTESFKTLVPQQLLFYFANPGEGEGVDEALDDIRDFYGDVEKFEDEKLEGGESSVQGTNWAVTARGAYQTYLINKLTVGMKGNADVPLWDEQVLNELNINDEYVAKRLRAIAAVVLGKTDEKDLRKYDLGDVLKHVTINERKVEQLTEEQFNTVTCWAGSHYDLKDEFRHDPNVEYQIDSVHNQNHKVGQKITHTREQAVLDRKVVDLEDEIKTYRREKNNGVVGVHDEMLLRVYTNVTYIAKEDASKQLEIKPKTGDTK